MYCKYKIIAKFDFVVKEVKVIIYINFVELEFIMLPPMFQDHATISSVGDDFLRFLQYMDMAAILVM